MEQYGPNVVAQEQRYRRLRILGHACVNPLVILLLVLAAVALMTGDARAATVMLSMVVLGVALRFIQESRADNAAAKLKAMISVTATVVRDGQPAELPLGRARARRRGPAGGRRHDPRRSPHRRLEGPVRHPVEPDRRIAAGGEVRRQRRFRRQAGAGTEEHLFPRHERRKRHGHRRDRRDRIQDLSGQHGPGASSARKSQTSFDQGVTRFTWLMIRFMLVMVPLVFLINGLTKHDWMEAFFFALAVAVGLTPEMLPMIVSVCLSRGAIAMSRKKVIVKRLNSIQNLGAMDVLCTDKTGTLTLDRVILERHCDVVRHEDEGGAGAGLSQQPLPDRAEERAGPRDPPIRGDSREFAVPNYKKIDEIPFDFSRKLMSVVVETPEGDPPLDLQGRHRGRVPALQPLRVGGKDLSRRSAADHRLKEECDELSADGFRVLAIAYKDVDRGRRPIRRTTSRI